MSKENSNRFTKEYRMKGYFDSSLFSLFAPSYFTGNSTLIQEEYSEDEHEVNPMIVDYVSV